MMNARFCSQDTNLLENLIEFVKIKNLMILKNSEVFTFLKRNSLFIMKRKNTKDNKLLSKNRAQNKYLRLSMYFHRNFHTK